MATIFDRNPIPTRGQLVAVAERRFRDAEALLATGDNERAAGAMYLAGYTVEVLLKGQLLNAHPAAARPPRRDEAEAVRSARRLIFASHAMVEMLDALPRVATTVRKAGDRAGRPYLAQLRLVCQTWTPLARYSPRSATIRQARDLLDRVRDLKELLK